jgi:hypothetical protein
MTVCIIPDRPILFNDNRTIKKIFIHRDYGIWGEGLEEHMTQEHKSLNDSTNKNMLYKHINSGALGT